MSCVQGMRRILLLIEIAIGVIPVVGYWLFSIIFCLGSIFFSGEFDQRFLILMIGGGAGLSGFSTLARGVYYNDQHQLKMSVMIKVSIGIATAFYLLISLLTDDIIESRRFVDIAFCILALTIAIHFLYLGYAQTSGQMTNKSP